MKFKSSLPIAFIFSIVILLGQAFAEESKSEGLDTLFYDQVHLVKGELETLKVHNLTRIAVTDPTIADISDATESEVLIIGQQVGQTTLFIWDDSGKRDIIINVVQNDPQLIKERINDLLVSAEIYGLNLAVNDNEGKVVLSGQISDKKRIQLEKIILPFSDEVINLVNDEEIEDLVQIDMQISELSTTLTKNLGIQWSTGTSASAGGSDFSPTYDETLLDYDGTPADFFKIGPFERTNVLKATIQAILSEGKGRILSQPKLVVVSGEEASFLVGGEIPIKSTTTTEGGQQEDVQFKEYGISMTVTPTITRGEKIDVVMGVRVSDVDASTAKTVSENVAFTTREANTRLFVDDGQTIIMAGLIRETKNELVTKVPFVADIPILGLLFRTKGSPLPNTDTELVIMMTPNILRSNTASKEKEGRIIDSEGTIAKYASKVKPYYSGVPSEMRAYVHDVQDRISKSIQYPSQAAQYGWEGTVKLNMLILHDGTLAFALVRESSGYDLIDDHALEIAKANAPFLSFPPETDLQELNVTIPIVYSLNRK